MADFDAVRKKRQEELELKKKRLEEMRKSKATRDSEEQAVPLPTPSSSSSSSSKRAEVDDLVKTLLGSSATGAGAAGTSAKTAPASTGGSVFDDNGLCMSCRRPEVLVAAVPVEQAPPLPPPLAVIRRPECYDKDTQTDAEDASLYGSSHLEKDEVLCPACQKLSPGGGGGHANSSPLRHQRRRTFSSSRDAGDELAASSGDALEAAALADALAQAQSQALTQALAPERRRLTDKEAEDILASPAFSDFFSRSAAVVEKMLFSPPGGVDPLKDYRGSGSSRGGNEGSRLSVLASVGEEQLQGRTVTSLSFSPHHPELFCVSYGGKGGGGGGGGSATAVGDDCPGAVFVFSTGFLGRPEFRLAALSPVLVALFHPHDPHIVVGGCYSGQVVAWDLRACRSGLEMPALRSNMSGKGHKHPVYSMCFAPPGAGASSSALELVSVSSDGQLCHWDLSSTLPGSGSGPGSSSLAQQLLEPLVVATLQAPLPDSDSSLSLTGASSGLTQCPTISTMTFGSHPGASDSREGVVGTGTGQLFRFPMPFTGASVATSIEAHSGLVTAMHLHPSSSRVCRNLLLTASLDWTTKLWNVSSSSAPLLEFRTQTYDYVCDVAWSPTHPAVFATICTSGSLFIWNLSKSTSEPWESLSLRGGRGALNKLTWSRDGRLLLVGDCAGSVCVVALSAPIVPEGGDEGRFELAVRAASRQDASSSASTTAPTDEDTNNEDDDL